MNTYETNKQKAGFFRRQFQAQHTLKQDIFDWTFGVILPVICFVLDPFVFKTDGIFGRDFAGSPLLGSVKPFAYILSIACIIAMMAWLMWSRNLKSANAPLAGLFATGALVSLVVGVGLFPFSLLGLILGIGILGFTPLFTAMVFFRNSFRAFEVSKTLEIGFLRRSVILAAILAFTIPYVANQNINAFVAQTAASDVSTITRNTGLLRIVAPVTDMEPFLRNGSGDTEKERLAIYSEITGMTPPTYWPDNGF